MPIKALKNLKIQYGTNSSKSPKNIHKYSIYMQSKDSSWLNRNITNGTYDEDYSSEPIEEDIRD